MAAVAAAADLGCDAACVDFGAQAFGVVAAVGPELAGVVAGGEDCVE